MISCPYCGSYGGHVNLRGGHECAGCGHILIPPSNPIPYYGPETGGVASLERVTQSILLFGHIFVELSPVLEDQQVIFSRMMRQLAQ